MEQLLTIQTKYLGPTTYCGSRLKAWNPCNKKANITVPFDYALSHYEGHEKVVEQLLAKCYPTFIDAPRYKGKLDNECYVFIIDNRGY